MSAHLHINYGPELGEPEFTGKERSAAWCPKCKKRRVQKLYTRWPKEPSPYGGVAYWICPCGGIADSWGYP